MNNLYEMFKKSQIMYKNFEDEKKELEKGENFIKFKKDLQNVLCDILQGKEEHYFYSDIKEFYEEKVGIKCKESRYGCYVPLSFVGIGNCMFKLNKTNLNKIEKYMNKGDDDLSIE